MTKTITLSFPDPVFTRMVKALSSYFGWTPTVDDGTGNQIPNPVSRKDFLLTNLRRWLLDIAKDTEINDLTSQARIRADQDVNSARDAAKITSAELDVTVTNG